ncbi:MAG: ThuA domain-containing protein [Tannerella sp.]|jgi:type 1 glutamine amidotransferase|nr:ThuA domain-containing protein [Tannerella sp.]
MKKTVLASMLSVCVAAFFACTSCGRQPLKALIVTGQNNHNWQVSHVAFKQMLENAGLFTVDFAVSPGKGEDMSGFVPDFTSYDLLLLDYNGDRWPEETDRRLLEYAENGGGIIVYHAADNAFSQWAEYNQICALGGWENRDEKSGPYVYWKDGRLVKDTSPGPGGSHGKQHEYRLNGRDREHPVTKGLPAQWLHAQDELYDRMRGPGNIGALLYTAYSDTATRGSGREEPLVFTVDYGKARIFHLMLGHAGASLEDNTAMQCAGFQTLLLRGAEWAATGKVTQPVPADFPTATQVSLRKEYREKK